jgi:hypothetical protein
MRVTKNLDGVSGGTMLQNAFSNVLKSIGEGLGRALRPESDRLHGAG